MRVRVVALLACTAALLTAGSRVRGQQTVAAPPLRTVALPPDEMTVFDIEPPEFTARLPSTVVAIALPPPVPGIPGTLKPSCMNPIDDTVALTAVAPVKTVSTPPASTVELKVEPPEDTVS